MVRQLRLLLPTACRFPFLWRLGAVELIAGKPGAQVADNIQISGIPPFNEGRWPARFRIADGGSKCNGRLAGVAGGAVPGDIAQVDGI